MKKKSCFKKVFGILFTSMLILFVVLPLAVQAESDTNVIVPKPYITSAAMEGQMLKIHFEVPEFEYQRRAYYRVQCAKNGNWDNPIENYTTYSKDLYFTQLNRGEKYSFRVRAELSYYDINYEYHHYESEWSDVVTKVITDPAVKLKSVQSAGADKIKITWERAYTGTGYKIYRSTQKDGKYSLVKTIKNLDTTSWENTGREPGKTYYYKVCTYSSGLNGEFSEIKSAYARPLRKTLTATAGGVSSVALSWKNTEKKVDGYEIYRAEQEKGEYKLIKTIKDSSTLSYKDKNKTFGKYYYYKMRAYCNTDEGKVYSLYSTVKKARAMVAAPVLNSVKLAGITKAKLTWEKVPNASGYQIYRSTSQNDGYKRIKTISGNKTFSHTAGYLINGNMYYFKVRAYYKKDGKTYYGEYSSVKKRMMNKVAYEYESYESRANRIFGTDYYKEYKTASAASKNMKTIKIKTWDINSKGKKYTRYHYLTVHKNIAETVQQIFKEIYNGKEKFPIKDVGGYSWRGDTSSSEHCEGLAIDINANENAQIDGYTGKPIVGSFYKPGENPYSIPANGDVVNAFRKYGFSWGNWFWNPDFMHFSYFGR